MTQRVIKGRGDEGGGAGRGELRKWLLLQVVRCLQAGPMAAATEGLCVARGFWSLSLLLSQLKRRRMEDTWEREAAEG